MTVRFKDSDVVKLPLDGLSQDGELVNLFGKITSLSKAHAMVRLTAIPEGYTLTFDTKGQAVVIQPGGEVPEGSTIIEVGDIVPLHYSCLAPMEDSSPRNMLTRQEAETILGSALSKQLDNFIERGTITPTRYGKFSRMEIEAVATAYQNIRAELSRTAEAANRRQIARDYIDRVNG